MARLLLLEDDQSLIDGLVYALTKEGFALDVAMTVREARAQLAAQAYDLLLLDQTLPDGSGLALCEEVRAGGNAVPIIFLTAMDEEIQVIRALDAGGDDYITKPFGMMEFVARVKAVLRRCSKQEDDKELRYGDLSLSVGKHKVHWKDTSVELTRKEFELLQYLMENKGLVMSRNQILCHVWGYDFDGETRTVDVHVRTLRQKLGEAGNLIETVRGVGYRIGV